MAKEQRLIDANALKALFDERYDCAFMQSHTRPNIAHWEGVSIGVNWGRNTIADAPTVDAVEVVHGRWEKCGGDLHSSGYAVYCSVCNKTYFVHYEYSLGSLYGHKELFEKPKYCPSCGAVMDGEI